MWSGPARIPGIIIHPMLDHDGNLSGTRGTPADSLSVVHPLSKILIKRGTNVLPPVELGI